MKPVLSFVLGLLVFSSSISAQEADDAGSFRLFFEKVYLHTDREIYAPGENIWFKAYLVNGQSNQLFGSSSNLYVELISPASAVIDRQVVRMDKGLGKGDFILQASAVSGNYRLRAYTNWMRNFGDNFVFEKRIKVYASDATPEPAPAVQSSAFLPVRFFPEGGSLIENVNGRIALKTENEPGKGAAVKGAVRSPSGDTITTFGSDKSGLGSFMFLPSPGITYTATGTFADGRPFTTTLPAALLRGFSLFTKASDSTVKVTVSTNAATLAEHQGKELRLTGKSRGIAFCSLKFMLTEQQVTVSLPTNRFPEGVASLTLYDDSDRPQCERLIFIEGKDKVNLELATDKPGYAPREKVNLQIRANDQDSLPVAADLSLSVVDAGMIPVNESSIVSYLQLQSELKGDIENPASYFDDNDPDRKRRLDLLLLTQGWRDFIWKRIEDSTRRISYTVERGITVSGTVTKSLTDKKALPGINVTLTAWENKGNKFFNATTDSAGKFYVDGLQLWGSAFIDLTAVDAKMKPVGFIVADTAEILAYPVRPRVLWSFPVMKEFVAESARRVKATRRTLSDTIELKAVSLTAEKMSGIKLVDTTFLITKADYQLQYLGQYLNKLRQANPDMFRGMTPVGLRPSPILFSSDPPKPPKERLSVYQYILDYQLKNYFYTPMDKIESIRLVHNRHQGFITSFFDGRPLNVVDVFLNVKPHAFEKQGTKKLNFDIEGYYQAREFFSPGYEKPSSKPDVRTTLYWAPDVHTDNEGKAALSWYNADPKSKIRVVAEGITGNGIPFSAMVTYEVK